MLDSTTIACTAEKVERVLDFLRGGEGKQFNRLMESFTPEQLEATLTEACALELDESASDADRDLAEKILTMAAEARKLLEGSAKERTTASGG